MQVEAHPTAFELEAHHVGEGTASIARHVRGCDPCAGYVRALEEEARDFRARARPAAFVRAIRRRAGAPRRRTFTFLLPLVGALGAAALTVVALRPPSSQRRLDADALRPRGGSAGPSVAVILRHARDGHQSRHQTEAEAQPGDRFRVEVTLDRSAELEAVLIDEAGARTVLTPRRVFPAGTQVLEPTFTFDARPYTARVVAGPPEAVARVLAGQPDARASTVRLHVAGLGP